MKLTLKEAENFFFGRMNKEEREAFEGTFIEEDIAFLKAFMALEKALIAQYIVGELKNPSKEIEHFYNHHIKNQPTLYGEIHSNIAKAHVEGRLPGEHSKRFGGDARNWAAIAKAREAANSIKNGPQNPEL